MLFIDPAVTRRGAELGGSRAQNIHSPWMGRTKPPSLLGLLADVESTCDSFLSTFGSRSDFKPVIFKKSGLQYFPTDSVRRLKTQDFVRLVRPPEATTIRWFEPLYGP